MNENVENLILVQLREMRTDMEGIRSEIGSLREQVEGLDAKVDGNTLILSMLAGHVHGLEERIEAVEDTLSGGRT